MEITITSESDMKKFGARLAGALTSSDGPKVLELIGDIGAGKTTLVKGLAQGLGVTEEVSSPSFTISRVYEARDGLQLYHYDFYRLTDAGILRDELAEVLTDPQAITVIEWAEIVDDVLPDSHIRLTIRATGETTRDVIMYGLNGELVLILGLQTSDPICHVWIDDTEYTWEAGRTLAHGLLGYLEECLHKEGRTFKDISGIVVFRGPGSFTGLRIGITVMNTISDSESIPIVGETGETWLDQGRERLTRGDDDKIVLPEYGGEAHITQPKK